MPSVVITVDETRRIELDKGDLTREPTDAIVNAANSSLLGGGGVDGAIHRAGGPAILEACRAIRNARGPLATGHAVATPGGKLSARHVIHTVGPVWQDGTRGEPALLAACYRASIELADELGLTSLAFPSISTGAFRFPIAEAASIALPAAREALITAQNVRLVRFVLFDDATLAAYQRAATP